MAKRTYRGAVFNPGDRVEINPVSDEWKRGDKFGEVTKTTRGGASVQVKMDSGEIIARHASMFRPI